MENSVPEQKWSTQQDTKIYWGILSAVGSVIKWLASFMQLTEAEREEGGIHIGRVDGQ